MIVILGHSGFIGQHLVQCCRRTSDVAPLVDDELVLPDLDLCNPEQIKALAPYFKPDTSVVMCAGIKRQWGDTLDIFRQNMAMVENVCGVLEQCPVKRFIYLSSGAVYGEDVHNTSISESTPIRLGTYYAISKYTSECLLAKVSKSHPGISMVMVRPPLVYGRGDSSNGYGPASFVDSLRHDREISLWGDGSELREFLYVKDLARLLCELLRSTYSGVINPVSGVSCSFRDVVDTLGTLLGKTPRIVTRPRSKEKVDAIFNGALVREVFPDFKFLPLSKGLEEMV